MCRFLCGRKFPTGDFLTCLGPISETPFQLFGGGLPVVPNLFDTGDQFRGKQFFHRPGSVLGGDRRQSSGGNTSPSVEGKEGCGGLLTIGSVILKFFQMILISS